MKRLLVVLGLGTILIGPSPLVNVQAESDLASQILEGEFSDESKKSVYNKLKEILDTVSESIENETNIDGIIGIDELINYFGDDYTYTEDAIQYEMWVAVDTFKLTASINENNQVDYLYGFYYPTFENQETSDSETVLEIVRDIITKPDTLPTFEEVDENYDAYDFSFIQDEMTFIEGSQSYTYDWASKELIQHEVGQTNYGRANLEVTQEQINNLNEADDLSIQTVIDTVGENWTYIHNLQDNSKQFIWQDPLGKNVTVDVTDELMVNRIDTEGLNSN